MTLVAALAWAASPQLFAAGQPSAGEPVLVTPPERYLTDVAASEDAQSIVQESLKTTLLGGIRAFDWARVARGVASDFRGRFPRPEQGRVIQDDLLSIRQYEASGLDVIDREGFLETLRRHVGSWTSVDRASWQTFEFLLEPHRKRAFARGHLQLGGPRSSGERSVLDATVAVHVVEVAHNQWELSRLELEQGTRVDNPRPPFGDITDATGFHLNRSAGSAEVRQGIIDTRASLIDSSMTVLDWNRDGFPDILVTESMSHSVLFLNDGKGGFVRGELPIRDRRFFPSQVLFVDLDNDAAPDFAMASYSSNRIVAIMPGAVGDWAQELDEGAAPIEVPAGEERTLAIASTQQVLQRVGLRVHGRRQERLLRGLQFGQVRLEGAGLEPPHRGGT